MNFKVKFVLSISLMCLLYLMLPGSLRADTFYTFTSNPYTVCQGGYTCTGTTPFLSATFDVLAGTPLANVSNEDIVADLSAYTITDGSGVLITQYSPPDVLTFLISTDSDGNITLATLNAMNILGPGLFFSPYEYGAEIDTGSILGLSTCSGVFAITGDILSGGCSVADSPSYTTGTWTMVTTPVTTPEPSSLLLMATFLMALGPVLRKKLW